MKYCILRKIYIKDFSIYYIDEKSKIFLMDFEYSSRLGQTLRISLKDGRLLQGQFAAVDRNENILIRYCELIGGTKSCWLLAKVNLVRRNRFLGVINVPKQFIDAVLRIWSLSRKLEIISSIELTTLVYVRKSAPQYLLMMTSFSSDKHRVRIPI